MKNIIDLLPKRTKVVGPKAFLNMSAEDRSNTQKVTFIPPKMGSENFGHFVVTLKHPIYTLADAE